MDSETIATFQLSSRIRVRDAIEVMGGKHPKILWPEDVGEAEIRLALARETFLKKGNTRCLATMIPVGLLAGSWVRDLLLGSRARVSLLNLPEGGWAIIGYDDSFDLCHLDGLLPWFRLEKA